MIIYRINCFSSLQDNMMLEKLVKKLDDSRLEDYEVSNRIPRDTISIIPSTDPTIYIPTDMEYSQYGIDDFVRSMKSSLRSNTILDRNIYKMTFSGKFTLEQIFKLVKYIISEEEFCILLEN